MLVDDDDDSDDDFLLSWKKRISLNEIKSTLENVLNILRN